MQRVARLHTWAAAQPALRVLTGIVRVMLALAFVPSGLVKILDRPFTTLPATDPVGYFFAGFFSAHGYYQFVGIAQWTAAILLLIPRTATLGALVYLPIVVNIFAITLAIGPAFRWTRVITGTMLLANVYLLCWDWDRWKTLFPSGDRRDQRDGELSTTIALLGAAALALYGVTGVHLARLRHGNYTAPLAVVTIAALVGILSLVRAYRRAQILR